MYSLNLLEPSAGPADKSNMTSGLTWLERAFALALIAALAACGQADEPQVAAPVAEEVAEPEPAAEPEPDPISRMGNEIFVAEDPDDFSPGVPVGERFPDIRARYQGEEITNIDGFLDDRGAVFIAVRSVNW